MNKRRLIPSMILLLIMLLPFAVSAAGNTTLDWTTGTYDFNIADTSNAGNGTLGVGIPDPSTGGPFTFNSGAAQRDVSFVLTGDTQDVDRFRAVSNYLEVRGMDGAATTNVYTLTIQFDSYVSDVQFQILNFDDFSGSNRVFQATVTADNGVTPQLLNPVGVTVVGQTVTATGGGSNGTIDVNIPTLQAVQAITIVFTNADADPTTTGQMEYRIGNIAFSPSDALAVNMSQNDAMASSPALTALLLAGVLSAITAGWVVLNRRQEA
ncbi:MAG: hypothetical protein KDE51_05355 [Anaerolineales bacterium]|nr:hypothetical protein [Anaerolineales bacterium]